MVVVKDSVAEEEEEEEDSTAEEDMDSVAEEDPAASTTYVPDNDIYWSVIIPLTKSLIYIDILKTMI